MKQGLYAIYNGKEYIADDEKGHFELFTFKEEEGFVICYKGKNSSTYKKIVNRYEISEAYKITTYAIYKGFYCGILGGKDKYHRDIFFSAPSSQEEIDTIDVERAKQLGFKIWDRDAYRKVDVPIEELEIYEVREEHKI